MFRTARHSVTASYRGESGFTLVELIVVVVIMGVLLSIGSLNFRQYRVKSGIESQTRELYVEINGARINSIHTKMRHAVILNTSSYTLKNYTTNEPTTAGRTLATKTLSNPISTKTGATFTNKMILFDSTGFLDGVTETTLAVNPFNSGASQDCIVISASRTNMGRMTGGNCLF